MAEVLEPRRLLAAIEAGVLVGRGTAGNDVISVRRSGTDDVVITTNGASQTFDMDDFAGVRLQGFGGDDTFNMIDALVSPVVRNTTVQGGTGHDTLSYATRTAALRFTIDPTASSMTSGAHQDRWRGDVETVIGGSGNDRFDYGNFEEIPSEEEDLNFTFRLEGRGGNDHFDDSLSEGNNFGRIDVLGGDGDDFFADDEYGANFQFGEAGNDTFFYNNAAYVTRTTGGSGVDSITYGGFRQELDLRLTPDIENVNSVTGSVTVVFGNALSNRIDLGVNNDVDATVHGLGGNDTLLGGLGNNRLEGNEGNDSLVGGFGDDTLDGGSGTDTVDGGPGNDVILNAEVQPPSGTIGIVNGVLIADGQWGRDYITIERTGTDDVIVRVNEVSRTLDMDDFTSVRLRGMNGFDVIEVLDPLIAGSRVRRVSLEGGDGNDALRGSTFSPPPGTANDDVMRGGAGDDTLFGGSGFDLLDGGDGADHLDARDFTDDPDRAGGDTVIGGNGADRAELDAGDTASGVETTG